MLMTREATMMMQLTCIYPGGTRPLQIISLSQTLTLPGESDLYFCSATDGSGLIVAEVYVHGVMHITTTSAFCCISTSQVMGSEQIIVL